MIIRKITCRHLHLFQKSRKVRLFVLQSGYGVEIAIDAFRLAKRKMNIYTAHLQCILRSIKKPLLSMIIKVRKYRMGDSNPRFQGWKPCVLGQLDECGSQFYGCKNNKKSDMTNSLSQIFYSLACRSGSNLNPRRLPVLMVITWSSICIISLTVNSFTCVYSGTKRSKLMVYWIAE